MTYFPRIQYVAAQSRSSIFAKKFGIGQWSFLGLGSEKSGILSVEIVHKVNGTELPRR